MDGDWPKQPEEDSPAGRPAFGRVSGCGYCGLLDRHHTNSCASLWLVQREGQMDGVRLSGSNPCVARLLDDHKQQMLYNSAASSRSSLREMLCCASG